MSDSLWIIAPRDLIHAALPPCDLHGRVLCDGAGGLLADAAYIQARRLTAIRARLGDPGETRRISELAYAYGFTSDAHFSRAFRRAHGISASEARAAAGGDIPPAAAPDQIRLFHSWMRGG